EHVNASHIEQGRGYDENPTSWQEVYMPLSAFRSLSVGDEVTGIMIQTRRQAELAFGIDEIELVRFDELPQWYVEQQNQDVLQPHVTWPELAELPAAQRFDLDPPRVVDGKFVRGDGSRVFVLTPYMSEVQQHDLWGSLDPADAPKSHGLFDPDAHGWIYNEVLDQEKLLRLGFNSVSFWMPPKFWYEKVSYDIADAAELPSQNRQVPPFDETLDRIGLPIHMDLVCWPWTLGRPATREMLPPEVLTQGDHHWVYFRIIGPGKTLWLDMWDLYAERYAQGGANVLTYELMNEPSYIPQTDDHQAEFEMWLRDRFASVSAMNETWGTSFATFEAAAFFDDQVRTPKHLNRLFDYDEYLQERYLDLVKAGVEVVNGHLPDTLVGVQPLGAWTQSPREAVWTHKLMPHLSLAQTPTGGGSWTSGRGNSERPATALSASMASAPMENALLLAIAGERMIFDNEHSLEGQRQEDTSQLMWRQVIAGLDGLSVFNWVKRGWAWDQGRAHVEMLAERFPFTALNPAARRTEALRGVSDFAEQIQPIAADILPKPWGPDAKIAFVYSWDDARRRVYEPARLDKRAAYFAALTYSHWNMAVVPADQLLAEGGLDGFDVAVLPGAANVEGDLPTALETFVANGGTLIVGEETFDKDLYGRTISEKPHLVGAAIGDYAEQAIGRVSTTVAFGVDALPGVIEARQKARAVDAGPGVAVLAAGDDGQPLLTRKTHGDGHVYFQAGDLVGYPLAKLLWIALEDAARQEGGDGVPSSWRLAEITDVASGELATNLLLSRRSHAGNGYHALLMMNMDGFDKTVNVRLPLDGGTWSVELPVEGAEGAA
ncbi:MAG: beta-galactosidase, partial [Planctomycetota bacterium]